MALRMYDSQLCPRCAPCRRLPTSCYPETRGARRKYAILWHCRELRGGPRCVARCCYQCRLGCALASSRCIHLSLRALSCGVIFALLDVAEVALRELTAGVDEEFGGRSMMTTFTCNGCTRCRHVLNCFRMRQRHPHWIHSTRGVAEVSYFCAPMLLENVYHGP